jgi:ATP-binding cassette subfamily F protein 3
LGADGGATVFQAAQEAFREALDHARELEALRDALGDREPRPEELDRLDFLEDALVRCGYYTAESETRKILAGLGFAPDRQDVPLASLSGGWRMRVALAAVLLSRPSCLLLDEPTNHLDLEMRRSLAMALQSYSGALVIVSHDRSLLAACADRILVVADAHAREFDGDLDDYRQLKLKEGRARDGGDARVSRKDERRAAATARADLKQRLRPLEKQLAAIEARLAQLARDIGEIRAALADPALYENPDKERVAELGRAEARLAEQLAHAEEDWLHASARLEALREDTP